MIAEKACDLLALAFAHHARIHIDARQLIPDCFVD